MNVLIAGTAVATQCLATPLFTGPSPAPPAAPT